jgi:hypothetical protein
MTTPDERTSRDLIRIVNPHAPLIPGREGARASAILAGDAGRRFGVAVIAGRYWTMWNVARTAFRGPRMSGRP